MDRELSALERACRERPDDVSAGLALAAALERAGERGRAFTLRSRLSRAGSRDAAHELLRTGLHRPEQWRLHSVARPLRVVQGRVVKTPVGSTVWNLLASDVSIVIESRTGAGASSEFQRIDRRTLEFRRWRRGLVAPLGPRVVATNGTTVDLLNVDSGEVLNRGSRARENVLHSLATSGDRVLVTEFESFAVHVLALADDRLVPVGTWTTVDASTRLVATGRVLYQSDERRLVARSLEHGSLLWAYEDEIRLGERWLVSADEEGVLSTLVPRSLIPPEPIEERDPAGHVRWRGPEASVRLGDGVALLARPVARSLELRERATGRVLWERSSMTVAGAAVARDGVLVARATEERSLEVVALSLDDGGELWSAPLPRASGVVTLLHLGDGVLVAAQASDRLDLYRLEES